MTTLFTTHLCNAFLDAINVKSQNPLPCHVMPVQLGIDVVMLGRCVSSAWQFFFFFAETDFRSSFKFTGPMSCTKIIMPRILVRIFLAAPHTQCAGIRKRPIKLRPNIFYQINVTQLMEVMKTQQWRFLLISLFYCTWTPSIVVT